MNISTNFKSLTKTFIAAIAIAVGLSSCSKDDDVITPPAISGLAVIHASPTTEKLDIYVNDTKANSKDYVDFAYTNKIDYLSLYSGTRKLSINKKGNATPLLSENLTLEPQLGYSLFILDKLETVKFLLIKDDLTKPDAGKARIRFVNASSDAPALNLAIAGSATDLFTNKLFKEYTTFETITAADKVTFNVKNKETGAVVATLTDVKIEAGKIYTIWVKGLVATADDTKLGAAIFTHK